MSDEQREKEVLFKKFKKMVEAGGDEAAIGALIDVLADWCCCLGGSFNGRQSALSFAKSVARDVEKQINKTFNKDFN